MKLQLPMFGTYLKQSQRGNMASHCTGSVRVTTALTPVGLTIEVRSISSVISAVRCH